MLQECQVRGSCDSFRTGYLTATERILVVAVFHASRDPADIWKARVDET